MMVALLLYAYARGNRSSRGIERACVEDVAYRVICSNLVPDHSTIAEFRGAPRGGAGRAVHGRAQALSAGGAGVGRVVAIDGTKVQANAARGANRGYEQIAREILAEAADIDRREDELYGEARGDELPEQFRTSAGRRAALRQAREELERESARPDGGDSDGAGAAIELDPERFVTRSNGRRAWLREGRRALEERRAREARPIPRSRPERLRESARRLEEGLVVEREAYYGRFYRSALYPLPRRVNAYLRRWAGRKYKRLRTQKRYSQWLAGLLARQPGLFTHWRVARAY
ncbi:MAG: transposase [Thermoleophilaceae bacterium]|nr:transposase [Thermoleophilaceae bacterium]